MITFTIPLIPPSGNHSTKHTRAGRHYLTKETIQFRADIAVLCRQQIRGKAYEIHVHYYLPKGFRGDTDNLSKNLFDAIQRAGVIDTDSKLQDAHVHKRKDWANPRTEVTIQAVPRLY